MRITIVPEDGFMSVDSNGVRGMNFQDLNPNIHAIQWYGESGEIEWKKTETSEQRNETIASFDSYNFLLERYDDRVREILSERPIKIEG